jgi:hypothetical protein
MQVMFEDIDAPPVQVTPSTWRNSKIVQDGEMMTEEMKLQDAACQSKISSTIEVRPFLRFPLLSPPI